MYSGTNPQCLAQLVFITDMNPSIAAQVAELQCYFVLYFSGPPRLPWSRMRQGANGRAGPGAEPPDSTCPGSDGRPSPQEAGAT